MTDAKGHLTGMLLLFHLIEEEHCVSKKSDERSKIQFAGHLG